MQVALLNNLRAGRSKRQVARMLALLAQPLGCANDFYIVSRGRHESTTQTMFRLVCRPEMRKVYPSFPMSHVEDMPDTKAEIQALGGCA